MGYLYDTRLTYTCPPLNPTREGGVFAILPPSSGAKHRESSNFGHDIGGAGGQVKDSRSETGATGGSAGMR